MVEGIPTTPKGLENIKKIVVLMFENSSFDHVFGDYPGANGLMKDGKINPEYYNLAKPLSLPSDLENPRIYPAPVNAKKPLRRDYNHDFGDGMLVSLFGPIFNGGSSTPHPQPFPAKGVTFYSGFANGKPLTQSAQGAWEEAIGTTYPPTNSGFYTTYQDNTHQELAALTYFQHGDLKIFPEVAKNFVLCDNWHCDMPGHTMPNRLFIHCGQTGNSGIDDTDNINCNAYTIFDRIDEISPGDWKMYAQVTQTSNGEILGMLDTRFLNAGLQGYKGVPITEFETDCNNGTLPFYSFIMCWLPGNTHYTDTSMHPQSMLQGGENLIAAVYNTLRQSKSWDETLLVITFDENGGLYDHVMPPATTPPDSTKPVVDEVDGGYDSNGIWQNGGDCGNSWKLNSKFDFSLLGPRVPAILVSPG